METLTGVVSRLSKGTHGTAVNNVTVTSYNATFFINTRQILMQMDGPVMLEEGDRVTLAGSDKNGAFKVLAYRNLETKVSASKDYGIILIAGVTFSLISSFLISFLLTIFEFEAEGIFLGLLILLMLLASIAGTLYALKIRTALKTVMNK